jgi:tetratricopeptide (TPR) repeat protein
MFEKISGYYSEIGKIYEQIINDIVITARRPLRWNRSFDDFTMLYTQQLENAYSIIKVLDDVSRDEHIIILRCDRWKFSDIGPRSIPISEFTDAAECLQLINILTQSQIFLIISGSIVPLQIQSTFNLQQIHGIYFFRNYEFKYPINKRKVGGSFDKQEDLYEQLHKDILFYRQQYIHISRIDIFPTIEHAEKAISHLNDQQTTFLTYTLLMDILPQIPLLKFNLEDLTKICDTLYPNVGKETAHYINKIYEEPDEVMNFIQDPKFSQIVLRLHQRDQLNELFILQKPLINIQQRVLMSIETSKLVTVYLSKIISSDTLETMKSSSGELISIGIFILAIKSLLTARTIARRMADNGLISVLCQIDVVEGTRLLEIGFDRVMLHLCAAFRLQSINLAPDGVWYARLTSADSDFQLIKEQLQLNIEAPLSWLTFGNYLYFLHQSRQGKTYFDYLLNKLLEKHMDQSSIYCDAAFSYPMKVEENEKVIVENECDEGLKCIQSVKPNPTINEYEDQAGIVIQATNATLPKTSIDRSTALSNIADVYYQMKEYKLALEYYEQALESSGDFYWRSHYKQRIVTVKICLKSESEIV